MSGPSSALAFRPWHMGLAQSLLKAHADNHLAHAVIFTGAKGTGKTRFAEIFSVNLLCEMTDGSGNSCGQCRGCALYLAGTHPDFHQLLPPEGKQQITVDSVRAVKEKLLQSAQIHCNKVCVINRAEQLNERAANALLKVLEEPPKNTYFLLLSNQYQLLSATIRSRCMKVVLRLPDRQQLMDGLQTLFPNKCIEDVLDASRGFPEVAVSLLATETDNTTPGYVGVLLDCLHAKTNHLELLKGAVGSEIDLFLNQFQRVIVIATRCSLALKEYENNAIKRLADESSLDAVGYEFAQRLTSDRLQYIQTRILTAKDNSRFNPNATLLLERLIIDCFDGC